MSLGLNRLKDFGFELAGKWLLSGRDLKLQLDEAMGGKRDVLYAFVVDGTLRYIGKTAALLKARLQGYKTPPSVGDNGVSTNIKSHDHIVKALSDGSTVEIYILHGKAQQQYGEHVIRLAAGLENRLIGTFSPLWNGHALANYKAAVVKPVQSPPANVQSPRMAARGTRCNDAPGSARLYAADYPTRVVDLPDAAKTIAVQDFDNCFGQMEQALWCLSKHCRESLLSNQSSECLETLIWTIKDWWGVQGVVTESKVQIAKSIAKLEWTSSLFQPRQDIVDESFACAWVAEVLARSKELGVPRQELSLTSKVLHWLLPWHIPVYDAFVRSSLGIPSSLKPLEAYRKVSTELMHAARQIDVSKAAWLGDNDPRSPLRGLDKCLWWIGGGKDGNAKIIKNPWRVAHQLGLR